MQGENGLTPQISFDVYLAIDELVTNAISYGYDDGEHRIDLVLRLEGDTLSLWIEDDGKCVRSAAGAGAGPLGSA